LIGTLLVTALIVNASEAQAPIETNTSDVWVYQTIEQKITEKEYLYNLFSRAGLNWRFYQIEIIYFEESRCNLNINCKKPLKWFKSFIDLQAKNPSSSALGIGQFLNGTWENYECLGDRTNFYDTADCTLKAVQINGIKDWCADPSMVSKLSNYDISCG